MANLSGQFYLLIKCVNIIHCRKFVYKWSSTIIKEITYKDWKAKSITYNKKVNVMVTPNVVVSFHMTTYNVYCTSVHSVKVTWTKR